MTSYVSADSKSSLENIFYLDQPSLGLPNRDYYLDASTAEKAVPAYKQYMKNFLMEIDSGLDESTVNAFADKMVEIETDLATISAPDSERRIEQDIYKNYLIKELSEISSGFDWLKYINNLLSKAEGDNSVTENEKIVVYATDYLKDFFSKVASKYTAADWQNYLVWRVMKGRISYMSKALRDTAAPYNEAVRGVTAEQQRWMTCSDAADSSFPMPVGALFVEEAFPEENKAVTEELVANLKIAMGGIIEEAEWMDKETKTKATEKLGKITTNIAYPDYIMDPEDTKMDSDYAKVTIDKKAYFENIQQLTALGEAEGFGRLAKPVDRGEWYMGPATVNAYYSPNQNAITFPAGILQPPFYDPGQPISMNYGGIGMVIGHEITHGFDDSGAQFDGDGNLNNWWSEESLKEFEDAAWCMKQQYSRQFWEEAQLFVNGNLTIGENIADNGGIRESFVAYQTWSTSNNDYMPPGFDQFTHEQLFFLGQAQVWCGKSTEARAIQLQKTDPHSPGIFRVNVPALNFEEFGKAYQCTKGEDPEYPNEEETCRVW
jgi:membrane metallo-endopeptidase-like protein 1